LYEEAPVKHNLLTGAGVALTLLLASGGLVHPAYAQRPNDSRVPSYTNETQQLGYEHGYRDGADRGRQDRDRGQGRNSGSSDYLDSARYSYQPSFGSRRDYISGYQAGYQAGYDDGFSYYERPGRYGQVYGQPSSRGGGNARGGSIQRPPFDSGYREGVTAGQEDVQRNARSDYRQSDSYRRGDRNFQDGFDRGYQDGYGRNRYQTDGGGYYPNRGTNGPADTRDGVGMPQRTITVPATQQWTATGIRVNQGDRLMFQSSGEIQLRPGTNDPARPAGSLTGRRAPQSPLPNALAGALIGRIDSGQPFGIGDQTSIVAPASGLLYLGVNDDLLTDNSGQFTVTISW
jgi:hypothetical protein